MVDNRTNLSIPWRAVAIGSAVLAVASLAVAAIVATITKADTLSVVALAVAIIAFVIQIVVFIVQAAAATEQGRRAQEIYGSTLKVLATIEEKTSGTERAVSTISDRMLTAIIGKAIPDAVESGVSIDSASFSIEVAERVAELLKEVDSASNEDVRKPAIRRMAPSETQLGPVDAALEKLDKISFPENADIAEITARLGELDAATLQQIKLLAMDEAMFGGDIKLLGMSLSEDRQRQLGAANFIRPAHRTVQNNPTWMLTDDGHAASEILLARKVPRNAPPIVLKVRERAQG